MIKFSKYNIRIYKGRFFFELGWFPGLISPIIDERLFDLSIFSRDGECFTVFNLSIC